VVVTAQTLGAFHRRVLNRVLLFRLRPVLRIVDLTKERRMDDRDVIALEIVVDVRLPIAVELPIFSRCEAESFRDARIHFRVHVAVGFSERCGVAIEIDEEKSEPRLDAKLRKGARRFVESSYAVEFRRVEQTPVECIRPAVIAALQNGTLPLAFRDGTGAMT